MTIEIVCQSWQHCLQPLRLDCTKEIYFDDSFHKQDSTYFERPFSFLQSFKKDSILFCLYTNETHRFRIFRLLDKLPVTCPHADSCEDELQRGNLDDHLRYRCSGTMVACQFAASGCDFRGPSKSMAKHQTECRFKKEGKTFILS